MKRLKDLFLNKEERLYTEAIVDAGWSNLGEWTLLSSRYKDGFEQFYLFNCIKIWQKKIKEHGVVDGEKCNLYQMGEQIWG